MTQDEIIRMAREAGIKESDVVVFGHFPFEFYQLERFAALVAANERNRHAWTQEHWTEYEHAIAAAEREACAKVCEDIDNNEAPWKRNAVNCAAAIRAKT